MTTSSAGKKKSADATVPTTQATEESEIVQPELEQKIGDLMRQMVAEMQQLQTRMI